MNGTNETSPTAIDGIIMTSSASISLNGSITWEIAADTTVTSVVNDTTIMDQVTTIFPAYDGNNITVGGYENVTTDSANGWRDPQHIIFQLGLFVYTASFSTPHVLDLHVVASRGGMVLGTLLLILWGGVVVCQQDVVAWYVVFTIINFTQCCFWIVRNYPVSLSLDQEELFTKVFRPLHISRTQFSELLDIGQLKHLPDGASFAIEGVTCAGEHLSILLSGRLKVTCDQVFLHAVEPYQFVDSVEFDSRNDHRTDGHREKFQVSVRAIEDSKVWVTTAESLCNFLEQNPHPSAVISTLLGKDITHKLYQVQEMLLSHPQYIKVLSNRNHSSHLRHSVNQVSKPGDRERQTNGILRTSSPSDSIDSSSCSRNAVFQDEISLMMEDGVFYPVFLEDTPM